MASTENYYDSGKRNEVVPFIEKKSGKILEIGCADGGFSKHVEGHDEYWGVEPVAEAAKEASKILTRVLVGTLDTAFDQIPDNYFDTVICNDVIEHMTDHIGFLEKIKQKGKPDFQLVGSIPNVRYIKNLKELLFTKDWEYKEYGILDKTHYRFFTQKSFRKTLENAGYSIIRLEGINPIKRRLFPISRLLNNLLIFILGSDTRYIQFGFTSTPK